VDDDVAVVMNNKKESKTKEKQLADDLLKAALTGHTEVCPLCGGTFVSVALHYFSCPKTKEDQ